LQERFLLPGHPRASDLIRDKALEGRKYIKITDATVIPFSISSIQLADLGRNLSVLSPLTLAVHPGRSLDGFSYT